MAELQQKNQPPYQKPERGYSNGANLPTIVAPYLGMLNLDLHVMKRGRREAMTMLAMWNPTGKAQWQNSSSMKEGYNKSFPSA